MKIYDKDLFELGKEADKIRQSYHGKKTYYINNIQLNCTNVCALSCKFCAYARKTDDNDLYYMTVDKAIEYVGENGKDAIEIHMTGGIPIGMKLQYYIDLISGLKSSFPEKTVKGLTAVEVDYFAEKEGYSLKEVFSKLKTAGLDMLPGGGAEIFDEKVRNEICPDKIGSDRWLEVHEIAHGEGIKTNATMLYGHIDNWGNRIDHLERLWKLQEKTGGIEAFIPLKFHNKNTEYEHIPSTSAPEDLKVVAISRILLNNIPNIKGYWIMLGESTAQISLSYGANDLDGTIVKERITHAAGASSKEGLTEEELRGMITSAGYIPVERDTFYNELKVYV